MNTNSVKFESIPMEQQTAGRKPKVTTEAIIAAAWELFEKRGFAETTMAEIAESVGISRRSIFNYFPSKEALLTPLADQDAFVEQFREMLLARPVGEKIFESMRVVLSEMIPKSLELSSKVPGPEVRKALQSDAAIAYNRTYWATQMQEVAIERLAGDPNAAVKARFVGALTGQVLTELGTLNKAEGDSHNPAAAVQRVIGSLQDLFD
ncbi:MAG: hypothetical protein RL142_888 [Actinomycetota bacterium]|jgi:AcrR family transcriptional regulator